MRIVNFETRGVPGIAADENSGWHGLSQSDSGFPGTLPELIAQGADLLRIGRSLGQSPAIDLKAVRLLPPVPAPPKILCVGLNYDDHLQESGLKKPEYPEIFARFASSLIAHQDPIRRPRESTALDYEAELAVVIGKPGRYVPVERALEYVAGYTCLNEGSVREYQMHNRQFGLGKNFEASGSYGPWLMTRDEFGDPASHSVLTRINGVVRQRAPLNDMLLSVAQVVSYLSEGYRLRPGDLIAMGTPGALKPQPDDVEGRDLSRQYGPFPTPGLVHMRAGDSVEIEIDGLGVLRNPIVVDPSTADSAA
jgi:2-keto-4-pentenoate hydratase/2-oxohepta-3-ene-1,7-dioic acid hydratase in catechol pathway